VVLDGGLLVGPSDEGLKVIAMLPFASERITGEMPAEGDLIVSVNGEKESEIEAFQAAYDKIADGEMITVIFEREGKQYTATYEKSAMKSGQMMIENE